MIFGASRRCRNADKYSGYVQAVPAVERLRRFFVNGLPPVLIVFT